MQKVFIHIKTKLNNLKRLDEGEAQKRAAYLGVKQLLKVREGIMEL